MKASSEKDLGLSAKQKQYLKALAHPLSPLVQIGKEGLSTGVLSMIRTELTNHELIKVKIGSNSSLEKRQTAEIVAKSTDSQLVQLIGKTIILYSANPKRPKDKRITLPASKI